MKKKFYNTPCSIFTKGTATVRGSKVQALTPLHPNIKCARWGKSKDYEQSNQAVQTDANEFVVNIEAKYTGVSIGDIFVINSKTYKVLNDPVPHERFNGKIDNFAITINRTTDGS